jgi:acyl carrier protein
MCQIGYLGFFLLPDKTVKLRNKFLIFIREDKEVSTDGVDVLAIEKKVIEIISEQMGADKNEITRETSFINDLNADSLDTVELVMEFEDEFDMSIPDEEAEKIQTVGAAVDYIINIAQSKSKE